MTEPTTDRLVRPAAPVDVEALVTLRGIMFEAMGVAEDDPRWRAAARRWFVERLADPAYRIVVVEVRGGVVACAMGARRDAAPSPGVPEGGDVLVSNVCTLPSARGQGHGSAAFEAVLTWARETGVPRAELMATAEGRHLYERAGFSTTAFPAMRADLRAMMEP